MAYKLVGYFENWAQYRQAGGKFLPDQIDASLFTHINFAFGLFGFVTWSVDPNASRTGDKRYTGDYTIQPVEWNDQTALYPALKKLKGANLKTLLSIGGWSINSGDDKPDSGNPHPYGPYTYQLFSKMAADANGRSQFIASAIAYAQKYGFDGIDIDWEYPGYISRGGTPNDLPNFLSLVKEFRAKVPSGFLLTMAAPAIVPTGVSQQYHSDPKSYFAWLAQCAAEFDWLNVMTYDFHGAFDPITGVNAPLLQDSVPNGPFSLSNTVKDYLAAGIPKEKIVLGMPTYGRSFKVTGGLTDSNHGYGKPATAAAAGPATATPGVLSYYEIAPRIASKDLVRVWDDATLTPYAYSSKSGEWVTYDDSQSLAYKTAFVNAMGLGGAMVWAIDDDDFRAGFPLIRQIKSVLDDPSKGPKLPVGLTQGSDVDVQSLADAIKNAQDLGNFRTSALSVLFFVCGAEGNIDPDKFISNNKVDDSADRNDAKVFHDAAYVFSQLNGGVPNGASEQNVLDRFRTALNWDLGNNTSDHNVASEWDNYLFADEPKMQGYYSVGYQLVFEQSGEQAAKNLDNGIPRTATEYHYVGHFQKKGTTSQAALREGDGDNTAELWLEHPGNPPANSVNCTPDKGGDTPPPDTIQQDGVNYKLEKGSGGKPVSRQEQVRDVGALNQAVSQAYQTALQSYTPQYDNSGKLKTADPVTRLAQYSAQTQFHAQSNQVVASDNPDTLEPTDDHYDRPSNAPHAPPKQPTETTPNSLTHDNPKKFDRDAMQALLDLYGVTSGNYTDILNAAQSCSTSGLTQQSVAEQVIEGFVPGGTLVGALVQYGANKELLDWKKQQTQKQGRGTYYIDQEESQNQEQLLTSSVSAIFDLAMCFVGPPEGLVAGILRGLKNICSKFAEAGIDFAKKLPHTPKPEVPVPAPKPEPKPGGQPRPEPRRSLTSNQLGLTGHQLGRQPMPMEEGCTPEPESSPEPKAPEPPPEPELEATLTKILGDDTYKKYKEEVGNIKGSHPEFKNIPTEQLVAVRGYTARYYKMINSGLRKGNPDKDLELYIKAATEGLSEMPPFSEPVWRGARLDESAVAKYVPGKVVTEPAFVSTSKNFKLEFAENVEFFIKPDGGGKDVSALSVLPTEQEILFPPGTKFKVLKVERVGKTTLTGQSNVNFKIYLRELYL